MEGGLGIAWCGFVWVYSIGGISIVDVFCTCCHTLNAARLLFYLGYPLLLDLLEVRLGLARSTP